MMYFISIVPIPECFFLGNLGGAVIRLWLKSSSFGRNPEQEFHWSLKPRYTPQGVTVLMLGCQKWQMCVRVLKLLELGYIR